MGELKKRLEKNVVVLICCKLIGGDFRCLGKQLFFNTDMSAEYLCSLIDWRVDNALSSNYKSCLTNHIVLRYGVYDADKIRPRILSVPKRMRRVLGYPERSELSNKFMPLFMDEGGYGQHFLINNEN